MIFVKFVRFVNWWLIIMKIFIHIICIILAVILQTTLLPQIKLLGGMPNLVLLTVLTLIFINRFDEAIIWVIIGGILLDLTSPIRFGYYYFALLIIYFLIRLLIVRLFNNPSWIISAIFFLFASVLLDCYWIYYDCSINTLTIILANAIYNIIFGLILYYLMQYYYLPQDKISVNSIKPH